MWFQVLFHSPHRGTFHLSLTVLVHYRSPTSISLTPWSARIHTEFHVFRITQGLPRADQIFEHGPVTLFGASFQTLTLTISVPYRGPTTPPASRWFGLLRFRSPLLTESISLSVPPVTEMFHFTGYRVLSPILFRERRPGITPARLPHSEISGSKRICRYPKLIAAYHVLHRLLAPRHPLHALNSLFLSFLNCRFPIFTDV
jgi:hypothetical protein